MPSGKKEKNDKDSKEAQSKSRGEAASSGGRNYLILLIVIIVIVAAIVGYLVSYLRNGGTGGMISFQQFLGSFYSAQRVAIFITVYNINASSTTGQYTIPCAFSLISRITGSRQYHRNSSTVDFYILNTTSCTASHGLGNPNSANSVSNTILAACVSQIAKEPTIFINYSSVNTTIIKMNYLYTAGNAAFLRECGIASEIG